MKKLIGLYGTSNVGKSQTIKLVYKKLHEKFQGIIFHEDFEQITHENGDISVIVIINGKIIGIESQGDPNSRIFFSLPIFAKLKCDIILCATRTRGGTVIEVEKLNNEYEIIWIKKNWEQEKAKHEIENEKIATDILKIITEQLK